MTDETIESSGVFANLLGRSKARKAEGVTENTQADENIQEDEKPEEQAEAPAAEAPVDERREERARIKSILRSEEAKGKAESALHIALETDLAVEDARKVLGGLTQPERKSRLDEAMKSAQSQIGPDSDAQTSGPRLADRMRAKVADKPADTATMADRMRRKFS